MLYPEENNTINAIKHYLRSTIRTGSAVRTFWHYARLYDAVIDEFWKSNRRLQFCQ